MPFLISATSANPVMVGGRLNSSNDPYFNGLIDEVEIFDHALTQAEIKAIFLAGTEGKCKEPSKLDHFKCYQAEGHRPHVRVMKISGDSMPIPQRWSRK